MPKRFLIEAHASFNYLDWTIARNSRASCVSCFEVLADDLVGRVMGMKLMSVQPVTPYRFTLLAGSAVNIRQRCRSCRPLAVQIIIPWVISFAQIDSALGECSYSFDILSAVVTSAAGCTSLHTQTTCPQRKIWRCTVKDTQVRMRVVVQTLYGHSRAQPSGLVLRVHKSPRLWKFASGCGSVSTRLWSFSTGQTCHCLDLCPSD